MKNTPRVFAPLLVGSLFTVSAHAQTVSDEETKRLDPISVVGLRPVDIEDTTVSLTILDQTDLAVRNSTFIADELRAVPGLSVSRNGAVGGLTQVRLRGAEANQTLVLVDGIEVSDPITGETDFGLWSGLDAGRIEVLRGEQSTLYGSDAIGGVINIVTNTETGVAALAEIGSRGSFRADARGGIASDNAYLVVATNNNITGGTDTSGLDGETDGAQQYSGTIRAGVEFQGWQLSSLARYSNSSVGFDEDTDFDGLLNNTPAEIDTDQFTIGGSITGEAFGVSHLLRSSYHFTERDTENSTFDNVTDGQRFEIAYSPSLTLETAGARHTLSGLIEYEAEDYERRDAPAFFGDPNFAEEFNTLGLAAEYRMSAGALDADASVRFDENDDLFENAVTWRVGGAYAFQSIGGRLRGSAGEGVKNPTFTELFGFFPTSFIGNPDLVPERSVGWDIGWDQTIGNFQASITYFNAELRDEIVTSFTPTFLSTPENLEDDSSRQGVEFGAQWQATTALRLAVATTYTDSDDPTGAAEIRIPDWTGSLSADWQSEQGWRAGVALDIVGEQTDLNFGSFPAETVTLEAYALLSASLDVPVTDRIAITLRGENLTDSDAQDVFGFFRTGAAGFIGIRLR